MAFSTVNKGSLYQNNVLYTGNSSYGHGITGVGFQPDLVWIKKRNATADHEVYDAVRGTDKAIESNTNDSERTGVNLLHSFDADGFTVDDHGGINSANTFVSWNWKANGAGSANTDGSINTTATSVNTTAGFSISKYTGTGANATVGHGLGVAPKFIIIKDLNNSNSWYCYHAGIGNTHGLRLDTNDSKTDDATLWNDTTPTSSVFSVGSNTGTNRSANPMIAYCWAEVSGYSKFGRYNGNGSTDGTFVYTGFKPSWLVIKIDGNDSWRLWDNARDTKNVMQITLRTNTSDGDYGPDAANNLDFLSNGFKLRTGGGGYNSGSNVVSYAAFGQPVVSNSGQPGTAV